MRGHEIHCLVGKGSDLGVAAESRRLLCDFLRAIPVDIEDVAFAFAEAIRVDMKVVRMCCERLRSNEESRGEFAPIRFSHQRIGRRGISPVHEIRL